MSTSEKRNINWGRLILTLLGLGALYLFALNGRYCRTGADTVVMYDKWKKEWIAPDKVIYINPK